MSNKIIVIVGPTAVGKTYVSVELAKKLETQIISADSMQIYKLMDIGTAKVTEKEKQGITHHMIDIIYPDESYSVSLFKQNAENIIDELHKKEKVPIIVGGSGLYVNSIIYDLDFGKVESDSEIRDYYTNYYKENGEDKLYEKLKEVDPTSSEKIHKNNVKRVIRALEVYELTGKPFSSFSTDIRKKSDKYQTILIGLYMDRKELYPRINKRVDKMVEEGLIEEIKMLLDKGYNKDLVSMQAIGYKEIVEYLEGNITLEESIDLLKKNTRRFAKRQFTWFLNDESVKWFDVEDVNKIDILVEDIFCFIKNIK